MEYLFIRYFIVSFGLGEKKESKRIQQVQKTEKDKLKRRKGEKM